MADLNITFAAINSDATPDWDAAIAHISNLSGAELADLETSGYTTSEPDLANELRADIDLFRMAVEKGYRGMTVIFPRDLAVYVVDYDAPDFLYETVERLRISGVLDAAGFNG